MNNCNKSGGGGFGVLGSRFVVRRFGVGACFGDGMVFDGGDVVG